MTNTVIAVDGNGAVPPTLLGNKGLGPTRIATGGKIRAGIKVLTKKAAENPQAKEIYEHGVGAGHSFEQIEKLISEALPNLKMPLVPKNVPWFTVRGQDFPNPEIAAQILDAYGEARVDGVKRLYRFPVVFPSDVWQAVMPHDLIAWGANDKRFWSEYTPDGKVRYCKCYAPVQTTDTGKRIIRVFGGRKTMLRSENGGLCEPESCEQYQQRQCNLSGRFIFFIPGIKSISAFELPTNSFYAMNAAIQKFETIAFMRGGRISGFLDAQRTPFYLSKKLMEVPHIDETGRAVRVKQWIIELEAPIDVTALLRANDDGETAIVNARVASQVLEGPTDAPHIQHAPTYAERPVPTSGQGRPMDTPSAARPMSVMETRAAPSVEQVLALAGSYRLDVAYYEEYAGRRWGSGWKLNTGGRMRALDELERYRNDPQGFRDKVVAELKTPAKEEWS